MSTRKVPKSTSTVIEIISSTFYLAVGIKHLEGSGGHEGS